LALCRFLLVGIPGHYAANKAVSLVEMRGFRDRVRLASGGSAALDDASEAAEEGEEEEQQFHGYMAGRGRRECGVGWGGGIRAGLHRWGLQLDILVAWCKVLGSHLSSETRPLLKCGW
jgi:hypothetical protein